MKICRRIWFILLEIILTSIILESFLILCRFGVSMPKSEFEKRFICNFSRTLWLKIYFFLLSCKKGYQFAFYLIFREDWQFWQHARPLCTIFLLRSIYLHFLGFNLKKLHLGCLWYTQKVHVKLKTRQKTSTFETKSDTNKKLISKKYSFVYEQKVYQCRPKNLRIHSKMALSRKW